MNTESSDVEMWGEGDMGAGLGLEVGAKLELCTALCEGDLPPPFRISWGWGEGWPGPEVRLTGPCLSLCRYLFVPLQVWSLAKIPEHIVIPGLSPSEPQSRELTLHNRRFACLERCCLWGKRLPPPGTPQLPWNCPHWSQQLGTSRRGPRPTLEGLLLTSSSPASTSGTLSTRRWLGPTRPWPGSGTCVESGCSLRCTPRNT